MKRLWPNLILPGLHFVLVSAAAFAVHYSNGINVRGFSGDYGLWMDLGNLGNEVFQFSRWIVPVVLLLFVLRAKEKKKTGACFIAATFGVLVATWPLYATLIHFWERKWIPAV
jgi:hypothetical protein